MNKLSFNNKFYFEFLIFNKKGAIKEIQFKILNNFNFKDRLK